MNSSSHRDTSALVIGGTQGLGLAIAERLMAEGCTRIVIAGRDRTRGEAAAEASGAAYLPVDAADTAAVVRLVDEAAERMGRSTRSSTRRRSPTADRFSTRRLSSGTGS